MNPSENKPTADAELEIGSEEIYIASCVNDLGIAIARFAG